MIDVNDNAPVFDKTVYEFILSSSLRNFTTPAFVKATDADAEEPNNVVRYEIINGNYENKFRLDKYTGQLMLVEPLMAGRPKSRQKRQSRDSDVFVLTVRAYDLGVPVMFSMATIRIYPPESKTRTVTFVLPGRNIDRKKTEDILSTITGGRVIIHDIKPYDEGHGQMDGDGVDGTNAGIDFGGKGSGSGSGSGNGKDKSVVTATVLYDSNSVVDISQIQKRLQLNNATADIAVRDSTEAEVSFSVDLLVQKSLMRAVFQNLYKAENKILFWLLIAFAALIIAIILALLLCCICPWCPLYGATR